MSVCYCAMAGTAACKTCYNNPNADLSQGTSTYYFDYIYTECPDCKKLKEENENYKKELQRLETRLAVLTGLQKCSHDWEVAKEKYNVQWLVCTICGEERDIG